MFVKFIFLQTMQYYRSKKNITGVGYFCLRIFRKTLNARNFLIRLLDFCLGNFGTLLCLIFLDLKSCFKVYKFFVVEVYFCPIFSVQIMPYYRPLFFKIRNLN